MFEEFSLSYLLTRIGSKKQKRNYANNNNFEKGMGASFFTELVIDKK